MKLEGQRHSTICGLRKKSQELTVSILIPAYNEEKSIKRCIESCLSQTKRADEIIVVNDGSTDNTLKILKTFGDYIKIINIKKNTGNKSKAQEIGLKSVTTDIFITTDADTRLHRNFVREIMKSFRERKVSAVCGYVESERNNWVTRVREINYIVGQTIYKRAQNIVGAVFVLAGCSSGFRTKDFREVVTFDHDNVTEDLDFTYKLKLADKVITYNEKAVVFTQDPNNVSSYFRQLYRWYSGGWTCLRKNYKILKKPNNALILSPLYIEGLVMGIIVLLSPLLLFFSAKYYFYLLGIQFLVVGLTLSYGVAKFKRYDLYFYIPHHFVLGLFDQGIFLITFVKEIVLGKRNMKWHRADRY